MELTQQQLETLIEMIEAYELDKVARAKEIAATSKNIAIETAHKQIAESYKTRLDTAPTKEARALLIEQLTAEAKAIETDMLK